MNRGPRNIAHVDGEKAVGSGRKTHLHRMREVAAGLARPKLLARMTQNLNAIKTADSHLEAFAVGAKAQKNLDRHLTIGRKRRPRLGAGHLEGSTPLAAVPGDAVGQTRGPASGRARIRPRRKQRRHRSAEQTKNEQRAQSLHVPPYCTSTVQLEIAWPLPRTSIT